MEKQIIFCLLDIVVYFLPCNGFQFGWQAKSWTAASTHLQSPCSYCQLHRHLYPHPHLYPCPLPYLRHVVIVAVVVIVVIMFIAFRFPLDILPAISLL